MIDSAKLNNYFGSKRAQYGLRMDMIENGELPYKDFVDQLYIDLDKSIYNIQKNREFHQNSSEDMLSTWVLGQLDIIGYDTSHEAKTGGHVDLIIKLGGYTWIGEAKKDGNYEGGFDQLTTRYVSASGNFNHDHGGLIFYLVDIKNAKLVLNNWKKKLEDKKVVCQDCDKNALAFYSKHILEGSGTDFNIRSMAVSLFHQPQDASGLKTAANREAAKKISVKQAPAKKPVAKKPASKKPASKKPAAKAVQASK